MHEKDTAIEPYSELFQTNAWDFFVKIFNGF